MAGCLLPWIVFFADVVVVATNLAVRGSAAFLLFFLIGMHECKVTQ